MAIRKKADQTMGRNLAPALLLLLTTVAVAACSSGPGPDRTPPDAPRGLIAVAGDGRVTLSWTASQARDLARYRIWRRPENATAPTLCDSTTRTDAIVNALANGTTYLFSITSVDEAGNQSAPSREVGATPHNARSLILTGWAAWEAGDYSAAGTLFQNALNLDSRLAEAYTGLGWTALKQNDLAAAAAGFNAAVQRDPATEDARVGGLIVYRELPNGLSQAMVYGSQALQRAPDYVFSHDPAVDAALVRLLLAQVYYLSGSLWFPQAQALLDVLVPGNGLDPADPGSWTVQSTSYASYPAALLALLVYAGGP